MNRDTDPLRRLSDQVEGRIATAMAGGVEAEVKQLRHGAEN